MLPSSITTTITTATATSTTAAAGTITSGPERPRRTGNASIWAVAFTKIQPRRRLIRRPHSFRVELPAPRKRSDALAPASATIRQ